MGELGDERAGRAHALRLIALARARPRPLAGEPLRLAGERRARRERLEAASVRAVALAARAVDLDHDVPSSAPRPDGAAVQLAAENQAAADAGPERQHHRLAGAARCAGPVLGQHRQVGIVVDEYGQPEPFGHDVAERHAPQREVGRADRDAGALVDQRRDPEADRLDLAAGGFAQFFHRLYGGLEQGRLVETR